MEALSTFFTDKENPNNEKKRPYLRDIFKVAKQEERFERGEIGMLQQSPSSVIV